MIAAKTHFVLTEKKLSFQTAKQTDIICSYFTTVLTVKIIIKTPIKLSLENLCRFALIHFQFTMLGCFAV